MNIEREELSGRIEHITYKNAQNGYTVFKLQADGEEITVTGSFPFVSVGEIVKLTGTYSVHPTYGPQFNAVECERQTPTTAATILKYLSSGAVKGIGPATAQKLFKRFGNDTLDIIKNQPERLAEIRGVSLEKALNISAEYNKQFSIQDLMFFLAKFKVSPEMAARVYKMFGESSVDTIKANPFVLCRGEIGISFERADEIADELGCSRYDSNRIAAGIEYILRHNLLNGHTCLPKAKVCSLGAVFLECEESDVERIADKLIAEKYLIERGIGDMQFVFLPAYYFAEEYIASKLMLLLRYSRPILLDELEIDHTENRLHIKYDEMQRKVIKTAFDNGVTILTGGPGTGKTTTLNGIIELFERKNLNVLLAAPTGRAAKRMSELTGREAKTIHRLLEVQWGEGDRPFFSYNEHNPLKCDVIIVDEMSMVDTLLFESLLRALKLGTRIVLVGDSDQLPSVSAGNVLYDIIQCGRLPFVCLEKIFRQADASLIVHNAHEIINGREPMLDSKEADFFMIDCKNPQMAAKTVVELCTERLPKAYGFSIFDDIQVLCPSRKLDMGTVALNQLLQEKINPVSNSQKHITNNGFTYREKDKVMQTKNNYDIMWRRDDGEQGMGVYNGDIGTIESIDIYSQLVTVRFDDRVASYYGAEISELEPAYAITVHKSQGSEFDCVILPVLNLQSQLTYRNLLYTAVTRAKRLLIIVGDRAAVKRMVENNRKMLRYSGLKEMLRDIFDEQEK